MKRYLFFLIFMFIFICCNVQQDIRQNILFKIKRNDTYYIFNEKKEFLFQCKYRIMGEFYDGIALFSTYDNKYGYINFKNEIILPPIYDDADNFHEGFGKIQLNELYGIVDKAGKVIIEPQYDYLGIFNNKIALAEKNGKQFYINEKNEVLDISSILENKYDEIFSFSDGLAAIKIENKIGYIDDRGEIVIKPTFEYAYLFIEGRICFDTLDANGKTVSGYLDKKGNIIIPPLYIIANSFHDGLAIVFKGEYFRDEKGEWLAIDYNGKIKVKFPIDSVYRVWNYSEGIFILTNMNNKYEYWDLNLNKIAGYEFDNAYMFKNGYAYVVYNGINNYINKNGNFLFEQDENEFHNLKSITNNSVVNNNPQN